MFNSHYIPVLDILKQAAVVSHTHLLKVTSKQADMLWFLIPTLYLFFGT